MKISQGSGGLSQKQSSDSASDREEAPIKIKTWKISSKKLWIEFGTKGGPFGFENFGVRKHKSAQKATFP